MICTRAGVALLALLLIAMMATPVLADHPWSGERGPHSKLTVSGDDHPWSGERGPHSKLTVSGDDHPWEGERGPHSKLTVSGDDHPWSGERGPHSKLTAIIGYLFGSCWRLF